MSIRLFRTLTALCGILGVIMLIPSFLINPGATIQPHGRPVDRFWKPVPQLHSHRSLATGCQPVSYHSLRHRHRSPGWSYNTLNGLDDLVWRNHPCDDEPDRSNILFECSKRESGNNGIDQPRSNLCCSARFLHGVSSSPLPAARNRHTQLTCTPPYVRLSGVCVSRYLRYLRNCRPLQSHSVSG